MSDSQVSETAGAPPVGQQTMPATVDEQIGFLLAQLGEAEREEFLRFVGDIDTPFSFHAVEYLEEDEFD